LLASSLIPSPPLINFPGELSHPISPSYSLSWRALSSHPPLLLTFPASSLIPVQTRVNVSKAHRQVGSELSYPIPPSCQLSWRALSSHPPLLWAICSIQSLPRSLTMPGERKKQDSLLNTISASVVDHLGGRGSVRSRAVCSIQPLPQSLATLVNHAG